MRFQCVSTASKHAQHASLHTAMHTQRFGSQPPRYRSSSGCCGCRKGAWVQLSTQLVPNAAVQLNAPLRQVLAHASGLEPIQSLHCDYAISPDDLRHGHLISSVPAATSGAACSHSTKRESACMQTSSEPLYSG